MGEIPFRHVNIHTTILAPDGRRMSKSLGTGIDPLELIDEHGADATRYGLLKMSSTQDVRFSVGAIEEGRKLANKLWNVSRLVLGEGRRTASPTRGRATRGALDLRAGSTRHAREVERRPRRLRLRARGRAGSTTSRSTTSATGTLEAIKPRLYERRRGCARDGRSPRSSGSSSCSIR